MVNDGYCSQEEPELSSLALGGLKLPVKPAPGRSDDSGLHEPLHSCVCMPPTHTLKMIKK